jgi:murein DD-endopeptidase MepM/ murein hydrolase activator NlpD
MRAAPLRVVIALAAVLVAGSATAQHGRVVAADDFSDALPTQVQARMRAETNANLIELLRAGRLAAPDGIAATVADLQWPLQPVPGFDQYDYHGTKYFVDHDPRIGFVQDYTCGQRTYDLASGYNHAGTDYYLWPFPWLMMDAGTVRIVAAAPGVIANKADGNFDRNCAIASTTNPNFVSILQDDGLTAIYLHMKSGSVTTLPVGTRVGTGDYLGTVGSSGQSSGPHLHFELRDSNNVVVDPRHGQCNAAPDRWAVFQAYEDPRIDTLSTHAAEPTSVDCGHVNGQNVDEVPSYQDHFDPGAAFWVFVSYADQRNGQVTNFSILRPDGSVFAQWDFDLASQNLPNPFYSGTSWDWQYTLPADAMNGNWTVRAVFQGRTYAHAFSVGAATQRDAADVAAARLQQGADAARCRPVEGTLAPQCQP